MALNFRSALGRWGSRWGFRALGLFAAFSMLLLLVHVSIVVFCRIEPPALTAPRSDEVRKSAKLRRLGDSFVVERDGLLEVHLSGSPEDIGYAHARLLYPEMVENEGILLGHFRDAVPTGALRHVLLDLAQLRYRGVADGMSRERRLEIAAGALGFQPDPYTDLFPTFQRFVYLNTLYDIALSFEHSPLIGCTTFVFSHSEAEGGGAVLARNFDFEVDAVFDRRKAVFFVKETGMIPFASVAWPGLVGVVSGMNLEGVAVVVHGGRAGEPRTVGEPVVHALRAVLSRSRTTTQAIEELSRRSPLVSHIVVITDASGHSVELERVPGSEDHVIELGDAAAVTNHFTGPSAKDPKNLAVRRATSTLPRKARADELVRSVPRPVTAASGVALLRDRRGAGGRELRLGDRDAIDALIATHGVIMSTADRTLWVSHAPHLLGAFSAFDLRRALGDGSEPEAELRTLPADPLLDSLHESP